MDASGNLWLPHNLTYPHITFSQNFLTYLSHITFRSVRVETLFLGDKVPLCRFSHFWWRRICGSMCICSLQHFVSRQFIDFFVKVRDRSSRSSRFITHRGALRGATVVFLLSDSATSCGDSIAWSQWSQWNVEIPYETMVSFGGCLRLEGGEWKTFVFGSLPDKIHFIESTITRVGPEMWYLSLPRTNGYKIKFWI